MKGNLRDVSGCCGIPLLNGNGDYSVHTHIVAFCISCLFTLLADMGLLKEKRNGEISWRENNKEVGPNPYVSGWMEADKGHLGSTRRWV